MIDTQDQISAAPFESQQVKREAQRLAYPVSGDSRGIARCSWLGTTYAFGEHNTEASWLQFSAWRADLLETGDAKAVRRIRVDSAHDHRRKRPTALVPSQLVWLLVASIVALIAGVGGASLMTGSNDTQMRSIAANTPGDVASTDDTSLTPFEKRVLDGVRTHIAQLSANERDAKASLLLKMISWAEQGRANEPPHITIARDKIAKYEEQLAKDPEGQRALSRVFYEDNGIEID